MQRRGATRKLFQGLVQAGDLRMTDARRDGAGQRNSQNSPCSRPEKTWTGPRSAL
jgi:hypothetical protein